MKKLVVSLFKALTEFLHVALFVFFIYLLFAILGAHQFNGKLYNSCRYNKQPESPNEWLIVSDITRVCSKSSYGRFFCPDDYYCGNPSEFHIDPYYDNVTVNSNILFGIQTFDSIGPALRTVFQIVTFDNWTIIMLNLMDGDI